MSLQPNSFTRDSLFDTIAEILQTSEAVLQTGPTLPLTAVMSQMLHRCTAGMCILSTPSVIQANECMYQSVDLENTEIRFHLCLVWR